VASAGPQDKRGVALAGPQDRNVPVCSTEPGACRNRFRREAEVSFRYCKVCAAEVDDVEGYCLLGHPLRLEPAIPSVAEMRDEVSRALGEARRDVAAESEPGGDAVTTVERASLDDLSDAAEMTWSPPPPVEDASRTVWGPLTEDLPAEGDPITAFAPASRMDWGPERTGIKSRNPLRRRARPAPA
jgi:hypothetical protein